MSVTVMGSGSPLRACRNAASAVLEMPLSLFLQVEDVRDDEQF
jgi:hypothetical protein